MTQKKTVTQKDIDAVWRAEWNRPAPTLHDLFTNRLFLEGYSVFKQYIPAGPVRMLDVGAGTGRYSLKFAQDFPEAQITITDILGESLVLARAYAEELGLQNVTTKREDVNVLSFPDESFDVVFCDVVIQHLPSTANAMKEMTRVLRPGGLIILSAVNKWNPHHLYKRIQEKRGIAYEYGFEQSYARRTLSDLLWRYHCEVVAMDGFYPAYGVFRLRDRIPGFSLLGKMLNRATKLADRASGRAFSKYFGFEIFAVGRKYAITVKHSGVIQLPAFNGRELGTLVTGEFEKSVPFPVKRTYFITDVKEYMSARGGHAHKTLSQVIFCVKGSFRLLLDDGEHQQKIYLRNPAYGIILGPKLWHSMSRFSKDCVILVLASDNYDESDYIRDHQQFLTYINEHPDT